MPASTSIPDRPAAVDRFARLSLIYGLLGDLENMAEQRDPEYPEYTDRSEAAERLREELDWLGDLPAGFNPVEEDSIVEQNALFEALWPEEDGPQTTESTEYRMADARASVLVARLLIRLAEHPDWLRERATERLSYAASMLSRAEKGGD